VLFLEHKGLYRQVYAKGPEGHADLLIPIGKAKTVREGTHATIVTWGALVHKSLLAAQTMEDRGYSVEVIDLRSIVPLDIEHIFESVRRTGRVLVAHEDVMFGGFGAEIVSQIADSCFSYLDAPVKRIGMKPVSAVPHAPGLEDVILPQTEDITSSLTELLSF
jgi:2-oxoisovalerate dehydrogenase E1 component